MFPKNYFGASHFSGKYFPPLVGVIVTKDDVRHVSGDDMPDLVNNIELALREDDEIIAIIVAGIQSGTI